ncbi:YciI family protein [Nonomuraea typhae]|uniref:YciI family protein n=1 Tax=Nonomuraea typhae TaxID=2603600 RepID=UPI0012F88D1A|nr:YciI family protein [Nonomuraea typhae]
MNYLLAIYQPDGEPPKELLDEVMPRVFAWDDQIKAAGKWVFAAPLHPASTATVVRAGDGDLLMTDGPFTEGKEHLGGFTVIRADDLDDALEWAGKLAEATGLPIEVRPIHGD